MLMTSFEKRLIVARISVFVSVRGVVKVSLYSC